MQFWSCLVFQDRLTSLSHYCSIVLFCRQVLRLVFMFRLKNVKLTSFVLDHRLLLHHILLEFHFPFPDDFSLIHGERSREILATKSLPLQMSLYIWDYNQVLELYSLLYVLKCLSKHWNHQCPAKEYLFVLIPQLFEHSIVFPSC